MDGPRTNPCDKNRVSLPVNVSPQRGIYSRRFAWAIGAAFSYVYFVELPRYKASAQLELTPGISRNQMI